MNKYIESENLSKATDKPMNDSFRESSLKELLLMYKNHERKLIWLSFIVAFIMGLSIFGRIFSFKP